MKKNKYKTSDREFQNLAIQVNDLLKINDGLIGDQKKQVETVMRLEKKFISSLKKHPRIIPVYQKFIHHIKQERGNILTAKSFFREKSKTFNARIAKAIRNEEAEKLLLFKPNYYLISFIIENWESDIPEVSREIFEEYCESRRILIENNIPLAINRAKLFYRKTPKSHLSLLDLIDICTYGLIVGIDKYVGTYSKVWASVCIGRMVGFMIAEYSKPFLKVYPADSKILYRANSLKHKLHIETIEELTKAVNESFKRDVEEGKRAPTQEISEAKIRDLLGAAGYIGAGPSDSENDEGLNAYDTASDESANPETMVEHKDAMSKVLILIKDLSIIDKKIIKLKGVSI